MVLISEVKKQPEIEHAHHAMTLGRPKWANFSMEEAFWKAMQQICKTHKILPNEFVKTATLQCPNYDIDVAVRILITKYFFEQMDRQPTSPRLQSALRRPITAHYYH